jgi:Flp pilus assembly protein TadG
MKIRILWRARRIFHSCEDGQAMIETALSSAFLLFILLGAMEVGMLTNAAIAVANSARAAAQYAAMNGGAWTRKGLDSTGMLSAAQADAGRLVSSVSFTRAPTYTCRCTGSGIANCSTAPPTGCTSSHLQVTITVMTQADYTPPIRVPGLNISHFTLKGYAQQEVLQ